MKLIQISGFSELLLCAGSNLQALFDTALELFYPFFCLLSALGSLSLLKRLLEIYAAVCVTFRHSPSGTPKQPALFVVAAAAATFYNRCRLGKIAEKDLV
jgi:hypothetical protein